MKRAIFFALLLLPMVGSAEDSEGKYSIYMPPGVISTCGTYVAARDEARKGNYEFENAHIAWLAGYITAYNAKTPDTYDIKADKDEASLYVWLENWCKQHPLEDFSTAAGWLLVELHPTRSRTAPK